MKLKQRMTPAIHARIAVVKARAALGKRKTWDAAVDLQRAQQAYRDTIKLEVINVPPEAD